jgi:hypothetical protein
MSASGPLLVLRTRYRGHNAHLYWVHDQYGSGGGSQQRSWWLPLLDGEDISKELDRWSGCPRPWEQGWDQDWAARYEWFLANLQRLVDSMEPRCAAYTNSDDRLLFVDGLPAFADPPVTGDPGWGVPRQAREIGTVLIDNSRGPCFAVCPELGQCAEGQTAEEAAAALDGKVNGALGSAGAAAEAQPRAWSVRISVGGPSGATAGQTGVLQCPDRPG